MPPERHQGTVDAHVNTKSVIWAAHHGSFGRIIVIQWSLSAHDIADDPADRTGLDACYRHGGRGTASPCASTDIEQRQIWPGAGQQDQAEAVAIVISTLRG